VYLATSDYNRGSRPQWPGSAQIQRRAQNGPCLLLPCVYPVLVAKPVSDDRYKYRTHAGMLEKLLKIFAGCPWKFPPTVWHCYLQRFFDLLIQ
jgi:hypothetical protein